MIAAAEVLGNRLPVADRTGLRDNFLLEGVGFGIAAGIAPGTVFGIDPDTAVDTAGCTDP